jgi:hypothetical protein
MTAVETCEAVALTAERAAWLRLEVRADLWALFDEGLNLSMTLDRPMSWDVETRLRIEVAGDLAHVLDCIGWEPSSIEPEQMRSLTFTRAAVRALEFLRTSRDGMESEVPQKVDELLSVRETPWADVTGEVA